MTTAQPIHTTTYHGAGRKQAGTHRGPMPERFGHQPFRSTDLTFRVETDRALFSSISIFQSEMHAYIHLSHACSHTWHGMRSRHDQTP
jgi:hypothetical protein